MGVCNIAKVTTPTQLRHLPEPNYTNLTIRI